MSDLISRQQAIDALKEAFNPSITNFVKAKMAIDNLPSAQPEKRTEERTETHACDSISRQAAIDALRKMQTYKLFSGDDMLLIDQAGAMTELMLLPSAQPEIIRCKDCKHWIPYDWMFSEVWQSRNMNDYPEDEMGCKWCDMSMKANDFCSRADRREVTNGN